MTFQGANVQKPFLDVSGVIDKGNIVVFDGNGSLTLPGKCPGAAFVRKAAAGVRGAFRCTRKKRSICHANAPQVGFSRQEAP